MILDRAAKPVRRDLSRGAVVLARRFLQRVKRRAIAKHTVRHQTPDGTFRHASADQWRHFHVGKNDTAWSFRDANFAEVIVGVDPDPLTAEDD
ncbi:MAG: hypothetical protein U0703_14200 [Anaerolineae bacterium]